VFKEEDACLGRPLCPDCYDYAAAVVWNAHAPELWRRTVIGIRRRLGKLAKAHGVLSGSKSRPTFGDLGRPARHGRGA
jgi:hypothetical protein